jgi:hypothetical protein
MRKFDLTFPIDVNGSTVAAVTIRRPKARDMVVVGDHVAVLARFYDANVTAMARQASGNEPETRSGMTPPDAKVYAAMIALAGQLTGLGENAAELDLVDLQEIAGLALNPGEPQGRGEQGSGDAQ